MDLTTFNLAKYCQNISIKVLQEEWQPSSWQRESFVLADNVPWVFGLTTVPKLTFQKFANVFLQLQNNPLGESLFSMNWRRSKRQLYTLNDLPKLSERFLNWANNPGASSSYTCCFSQFYSNSYSVDVYEVFLPESKWLPN